MSRKNMNEKNENADSESEKTGTDSTATQATSLIDRHFPKTKRILKSLFSRPKTEPKPRYPILYSYVPLEPGQIPKLPQQATYIPDKPLYLNTPHETKQFYSDRLLSRLSDAMGSTTSASYSHALVKDAQAFGELYKYLDKIDSDIGQNFLKQNPNPGSGPEETTNATRQDKESVPEKESPVSDSPGF